MDGFIRLCAAAPELKVADCRYNRAQIEQLLTNASGRNAAVVVFPELSLTGSTCGDLFSTTVLLREAEVELAQLLKNTADLPVLGVVEPGARAAAAASRNGEIVVIATEATISGGAYQQAIVRIRPEAQVRGRACTLFVPMAEEGLMHGPLAEGLAHHYLDDIFNPALTAPRPDTLLLGCTHFPLLQTALQNVVGPQVHIVDSAATTAACVSERLAQTNLLRPADRPGTSHFMTTDNRARFVRTGSLFLGERLHNADVELVDL